MEPFVTEGRLLPRSFETISDNVNDFVALFNIIDLTEGSSNPVVNILTEVIIAFGVLWNHFKIKSRSFLVFVLSKWAIGYPALLKVSNTCKEVFIPLLKIKVLVPFARSSYACNNLESISEFVYRSSEDYRQNSEFRKETRASPHRGGTGGTAE